jgi:hypothetical protein
MSYGMKILTKAGLTDISTIKSGQLVQTSDHTASSGTVSTPVGTTSVNSFAFAVANDGKPTPAITFSPTTNSISWANNIGSAVSSDFTINVIRFK